MERIGRQQSQVAMLKRQESADNPSLLSKVRKIQVYWEKSKFIFKAEKNPSLLLKLRNGKNFHFQEEIKQVSEGEAIKVTKIFF